MARAAGAEEEVQWNPGRRHPFPRFFTVAPVKSSLPRIRRPRIGHRMCDHGVGNSQPRGCVSDQGPLLLYRPLFIRHPSVLDDHGFQPSAGGPHVHLSLCLIAFEGKEENNEKKRKAVALAIVLCGAIFGWSAAADVTIP